MNIETLVKRERISLVLDAVLVGFFAAMVFLCIWTGQEWWMSAVCCIMLGQRLGKISMRSRIIDLLHHVQSQDAVVESLVNHIEGPAQQMPAPKTNGRIDYV